jgi:hypothetical protein
MGGNVTKRLWLRVGKLLALLVSVGVLLLTGIDPGALLFAIKLITGV